MLIGELLIADLLLDWICALQSFYLVIKYKWGLQKNSSPLRKSLNRFFELKCTFL